MVVLEILLRVITFPYHQYSLEVDICSLAMFLQENLLMHR